VQQMCRLGQELGQGDGARRRQAGRRQQEAREVGVQRECMSEGVYLDESQMISEAARRRREQRDEERTPSSAGPQHGLLDKSSVSSVELYLSASASATRPATSIRLSARLQTLSVRLRLSTWAMYVTPVCGSARYATRTRDQNLRPFGEIDSASKI
jgi:hypothetical protein